MALPPNLFAVPFGLAGLAVSWRTAQDPLALPPAIADALFLAAAAIWAVLTADLVRQSIRSPRAVVRQLEDPVLSPFLALPAIVALVLAAGPLPIAPDVAKIIILVAVVVVVAVGGWLTGQWMGGGLDRTRFHPGYFLPTVAGGFLAGNIAALAGYRTIGWMAFGIGALCWLLLGPVILDRLFLADALPAALVPTLAIEAAPPAVGGNAYFALHRGPDDTITYILAGYCVLMVLAQLRLLGRYRRLTFGPTFWSFTFSYSAVATYALHWIAHTDPDGGRLLGWLALTLITTLVAAIALQSVRAALAGRFLSPTPTPSPSPTENPSHA